MSSFFSDDEQDDQEQGRVQGQRQEPPARRGRAAPRLARHLRPTTAATADTASIPALEQDEGNGISFRSDVGNAGSDRRPGFGGLDLGLDEDELFGGAGNVPAEPQGHLLADIGLGGEQEEDEEEETEVKRLTKVWVRERGTPEIMQWEGELVEECLHRLQQQTSMLDLLRSDPTTSSEEHFKLIIVQTEMERVKYLVRAYLRCRLAKVEKYAQWIAGEHDARVQGRLSQLELAHAEKYAQLLHTHYSDSVLQSLPEKFRSLEVDFGTQRSMVRKPDMTQPVLIYCKKDLPDLVLSTGERAGLAAKSMHLVRYDLVERYITRGDVEVL